VTDSSFGTNLQGMADGRQKVVGIDSHLYARAFIVSTDERHLVAIVNADIWAVSPVVKAELLKRLSRIAPDVFREDNLLISGTHTHSAPGGYTDYLLYEETGGGFDPHSFECVVHGMVTAVANAYASLAPGKVYVKKGPVDDCGRQRSLQAYLRNPEKEREFWTKQNAPRPGDTDPEMLLLKFVAIDKGLERPIGVLSWYAIHPTDYGQLNHYISGDNKGNASARFEEAMRASGSFVAAFANSSCGDVSGSVELGRIPDGYGDRKQVEKHGEKQYKTARHLFDTATEADLLTGSIASRHTRVDMSNVSIKDVAGARTWPSALGLSFAAGSTEDSVAVVAVDIPVLKQITGGKVSLDLIEGLAEGAPPLNVDWSGYQTKRDAVAAVMQFKFGGWLPTVQFAKAHHPKPIVLAPGRLETPITPQVLPLQILKIGSLAVLGIPAEITTMAGRRLVDAVAKPLYDVDVKHVALATYANDYAQYISTKEEYDAQHYEGASTPFGPYTLKAYEQEFRSLADTLKNPKGPGPGKDRTPGTAPTARRVTFRNVTDTTVGVKVFDQSDKVAGSFLGSPRDEFRLLPRSDQACWLGDDEAQAWINDSAWVEHINPHQLVLVDERGGRITTYEPPFAADRYYKSRALVAERQPDGRGRIIYAGIDPQQNIYETTQPSLTGNWTAPRAFSGQAKELTIGKDGNDKTLIYYVGMDDKIYTTRQPASGGAWSQHVVGVNPKGRLVTVGRDLDGRVELFLTNENDTIIQTWETGRGTWESRDHGVKACAIAVGSFADGRLTFLYARRDDARVHQISQVTPNAAWGSPFTLDAWAKTMTIWRAPDGALTLFYAGRDDRIYALWQKDKAGPWDKHERLDGHARRIAALTGADGRPELVYVGMDDRVYQTAQQKNGSWSADRILGEPRVAAQGRLAVV
jgi:neutral ceramidase